MRGDGFQRACRGPNGVNEVTRAAIVAHGLQEPMRTMCRGERHHVLSAGSTVRKRHGNRRSQTLVRHQAFDGCEFGVVRSRGRERDSTRCRHVQSRVRQHIARQPSAWWRSVSHEPNGRLRVRCSMNIRTLRANDAFAGLREVSALRDHIVSCSGVKLFREVEGVTSANDHHCLRIQWVGKKQLGWWPRAPSALLLLLLRAIIT
mmetsp:Transcript_38574/g.119204  ORF Transcript_38574/g.119204 Transcript_38574/m.119204 type:complete len:204 (-) Transcript_38574:246-857(-)